MKRVWIDVPVETAPLMAANAYIVTPLFYIYNQRRLVVKESFQPVDMSYYRDHTGDWSGWAIYHVPTKRAAVYNLGSQRHAVCFALLISQMKCIEWDNSDIIGYWTNLKLPGKSPAEWVNEVGTGKITAEECDRQIMQLKLEELWEQTTT